MNYEYNLCVGGTERQTPSRVETDTTLVDEQEKSLKEMAYKWSPRLEDELSCDTLGNLMRRDEVADSYCNHVFIRYQII